MKTKLPSGCADPILGIGASCLGFNVRKTARLLAKAYDGAFAGCDLKSTQFPILVALHSHGALSIHRLAGMLALDRTTLTRNLGPLVRRGLVEISDGADRRTKAAAITGEGEALLQKALPQWERVQEAIKSQLGVGETEKLLETLGRLSRAVRG